MEAADTDYFPVIGRIGMWNGFFWRIPDKHDNRLVLLEVEVAVSK